MSYLFNIMKTSGFSFDKKVTHENITPISSFDVYLIIYLILKYNTQFLNFHNDLLTNGMSYHKLCSYMYIFLNRELSKFEYDLDCYLYRMCFIEYYKTYGLDYDDVSKRLLACISSNNEFSLINFNYTNPYAKHDSNNMLITSNGSSHDLVNIRRNIHGRLIPKNDYKKNRGYYSRQSPVIGISDEGIGITDSRYVFTKNYKIMRLSCNNYNNVFKDKKYIKNIKFFGQSFAPADYSYFFSIFDEFDILHSNVKLIFYYANHGGKNDDDCARAQMNKVDSLFFSYCKEKGLNESVSYCSRRSKEIIHALSFEGRLIISNLRDKVDGFKQSDTKSWKYPNLHEYIFRINSINELANAIYFKSLPNEYKEIKNLNKILHIGHNYFTKKEYSKFMNNYDKWRLILGSSHGNNAKKQECLSNITKCVSSILQGIKKRFSNKIVGIHGASVN